MPINFPNSPTTNQLYTYDNKTWQWNGVYWGVYSALTSYITSAYTAGDGVSDISGVTNGNLVLKSFSGVGLTITDSGDKLTFISSGSYLPTSGGTITGNTIFTSGLTATTISANTLSLPFTTGSVIFQGSGGTLNEKNSQFYWDNVNNRLGIGTATPFSPITVNGVISSGNNLGSSGGSTVQGELRSYQQNASPLYLSLQTSGNKSGLFRSNANYIIYYDTGNGDTVLNSGFSNANLRFTYLDSEKMRIFGPTGNVVIQNGGTFTDAGFRLEVQGTSRFTGAATFNNNMAIGGTLAVGTFTTAVASAQLEVVSTTKGFLPPRMTTTQRDAISSPATGLTVYQTTDNYLSLFNGTNWQNIVSPNSSGNVLIGTTTDAGFKLDVNGSVRTTGSISAATAIARGAYLNQTLVATANNDVLVGLDIQSTFTPGAFTGVAQIGIRTNGSIQSPIIFGATYLALSSGASTQPISFYLNQTSTLIARFFGTTGNLTLQNGGTFTDAGYRLDVIGTTRLSGNTLINGEANVSFLSLSNNTAVNNSGTILILGASGAWTGVRVPRYFETTGTISAATSIARGTYLNQTLVATSNNDVLVGLDIAPTFTNGAFTGVTNYAIRVAGDIVPSTDNSQILGSSSLRFNNIYAAQSVINTLFTGNIRSNLTGGVRISSNNGTQWAQWYDATGNLTLQNGGTFTDTGFRLDVNGTTKLRSTVRLGSINQPSAPTLTTNSTTGGTLTAATYFYRIVAVDFFGSTTTPSNELSVTTTGSTSSITLAWAVVSGAYSYRIYRGTTSGGQNLYYTVNGTNTTSFTDTGAAGTSGTTPTENLTAYGSYSTSSGDFRSGNITIVNNGIGNYSSILFDKSTDTPAINVVEYSSDSTMFEFSLRDNPDGGGDFFHWVLPDWQNPSSGWKPLKFANLDLQFIGSTSNFWSSFLLPSSTPYYTTNPDSLANSSIKWNPYTSNTYNLIKDSGTGTGNLNVEISGFTGASNRIYWVTIQSGATTFNWGINSFSTSPIGTGVSITGGWQTLDNGTQIKITGAVLAGDRWSFRAFPIPRLGVGTTTPTSPLQVSSTVQASGAIARGVNFNPTLVATANNDVLIGLDINPTFTTGAFTGVTSTALRVNGNILPSANGSFDLGVIATRFRDAWFSRNVNCGTIWANNVGFALTNLTIYNTSVAIVGTFFGTGNLLLSTGAQTDAGFKLDVNGTARISGATTLQGVVAVNSTNVSTGYALFVNGVIGATSLTLTQNLTMGENYAISNNGSQTIDIDANNDTTNAIFRVTANGTADELFRVNESGNFGIGTTSPTQKLQVSGNTLLQGSLTATTKTTIGSESDISCALLQMASTTQGVLFPRMTNTQRTSISSPVAGLMVYCTDSPEGLFIYKSTGWVQII